MKFYAVINNFCLCLCVYIYRYYANAVHRPREQCAAVHIRRCRGACCLDIGFRHMFSALGSVSISWCICRAARSPSCAYTDVSPGVGALVGGEPPNHLRLGFWCQFCAWWGLLVFSAAFCFTHDNMMNSHVVL